MKLLLIGIIITGSIVVACVAAEYLACRDGGCDRGNIERVRP